MKNKKTVEIQRFATIFLVLSLFFFIGTAKAETFCVDTATELQTALTQAQNNEEYDTIQVVMGFYVGNFTYASIKTNNLSIEGGYLAGCTSRVVEASNTVLDANSAGRVLVLTDNEIADIFIDGLRFQNGSSGNGNGAGLFATGTEGNITITNSMFNNNTTRVNGGAIYAASYSTVTITDNTISFNTADGDGGGVYLSDIDTVTFSSNTMNYNVADVGAGAAAVYISSPDATLVENVVSINTSGGIHVANGNTVVLADNTINNNDNKITNSNAVGALISSTNVTLTGNTISFNTDGGVSVIGDTVTLTNNTINSNSVGGVIVNGDTIALTGNVVNNNTGKDIGGGVYVYTSGFTPVNLTNNTVNNNTANDSGGGIYVSGSGIATLEDNTVNNNTAKSGGGVYVSTRTATLTGNNISNNTASTSSEGGGGVFVNSVSTAVLSGNTIDRNTSNYLGGGVYASKSNITLANNTITNNTTNAEGGGVHIDSTTTTTLTNNTISKNNATDSGGGVFFLLNNDNSITNIYNNIIWNNSATQGRDLYIKNDADDNSTPSTVSLFNNDFDQSTTGTFIQIALSIDPSNLDNLDPLFVDVTRNDYHVQIGSSCINAGDNNAPELPDKDKDSNSRIVDSVVDMGAYENTNITLAPDISVDITSNDFGTVNAGSASSSQAFIVTNAGNADLIISTISLTGTDSSEFNIQNDTCTGLTIAPSATCTVDVIFSPTTEGPKSANLSIPSDDPDTPVLDVPLSGKSAGITPDIQANGSDDPLVLQLGEDLSVTVSLNSGGNSGNADWWAYATTSFGTYWYTPDFSWQQSDTPIRVYGGALFNLATYTILEMSTLPTGVYVFNFEVDDNMDNVKDGTAAVSVEVTIE